MSLDLHPSRKVHVLEQPRRSTIHQDSASTLFLLRREKPRHSPLDLILVPARRLTPPCDRHGPDGPSRRGDDLGLHDGDCLGVIPGRCIDGGSVDRFVRRHCQRRGSASAVAQVAASDRLERINEGGGAALWREFLVLDEESSVTYVSVKQQPFTYKLEGCSRCRQLDDRGGRLGCNLRDEHSGGRYDSGGRKSNDVFHRHCNIDIASTADVRVRGEGIVHRAAVVFHGRCLLDGGSRIDTAAGSVATLGCTQVRYSIGNGAIEDLVAVPGLRVSLF